MKLKRLFCAVLAALLLFLCACTNNTAQSVSETENTVVSENQETIPTAVPSDTAAGEFVLPARENDAQENTVKAEDRGTTTLPAVGAAQTALTDAPSPEAPKAETVSLSVTCRNAIAYGILDDPNFQGVVPQSGVYFDNGTVEFTAGETVLTVLKRCLKAQKIVYQIDSSGYVKSIGGLSEFDCGAGSGWLYKVNGAQPNVSCKYYTLQAGDCVEFVYTCKMGDV